MVFPSRTKDEDWHGTLNLQFKGRHFRIATQRPNVNELCCQRGPQTTVYSEIKKLSWLCAVWFVILMCDFTEIKKLSWLIIKLIL